MSITAKTAIVIGASSGIGAACVQELARRGTKVAAVARREDLLKEVCDGADTTSGGAALPFAHDVTDYDAIPGLFERIVAELGGLEMIVYAAGAMPKVEVDEYTFEKDRTITEVNLLGCMAWLNQAALMFRKQGSGSIVGISSIAGDRGRIGNPAYHASKAAMSTYLESLRNRLTRHGACVTTIKPGFVDTAMTQGMDGLFWVISPEAAAKTIVDAALAGKHTRYVPWRWTMVGLAIRNIPSFIFRKMSI